MLFGLPGIETGEFDSHHIQLLLLQAIVSIAIAQSLWIWSAGSLGILLASFHLNAVPFYVMVTVVLLLNGEWNWGQTAGALIVALGVLVTQSGKRIE